MGWKHISHTFIFREIKYNTSWYPLLVMHVGKLFERTKLRSITKISVEVAQFCLVSTVEGTSQEMHTRVIQVASQKLRNIKVICTRQKKEATKGKPSKKSG